MLLQAQSSNVGFMGTLVRQGIYVIDVEGG
jgi:hypothetical protein